MRFSTIIKSMDVWIGLAFCLCAIAYTAYLGEDQNWDLQNYHYFTGYSYLTDRGDADIAAAGFQSFLYPAVNALAYTALSKLQFPFSVWLILSVQLLSVPALILISREIAKTLGEDYNGTPRHLAIIICLASPLWISELGTSFFSSTTAPFVLWGLYLLLKNTDQYQKRLWFLSGILFGLSLALKLTNAPFAIAAGASAVYITIRSKKWRPSRLTWFILGGIIGTLFAARWYWSLWDKWESPVFPLYNQIFKSPFYPLVNFRDDRWLFQSILDFFSFLTQAAVGSSKTSEFYFADPRYLIVLVFLPALALCHRSIKISLTSQAFLVFFFMGIGLWSKSLAYQRYLIPIELISGIATWVIIATLAKSKQAQIYAMLCATGICLALIKIPDWGHAQSTTDIHAPIDIIWKRPASKIESGENVHNGAFNLVIPGNLATTPANYLVIGNPLSYILPYLDPASHFYGMGVSPEIDELIQKRLKSDRGLPIRILVSEDSTQSIRSIITSLGLAEAPLEFNCSYIISSISRYKVCELLNKTEKLHTQAVRAEAIYDEGKYKYKADGILFEKGLSHIESWGRWSDSDTVEWGLDKCLPKGHISIDITAHAFGPNIAKQFTLVIGEQTKYFLLKGTDSTVSVQFDNAQFCADKVAIEVPASTSPQSLGMNSDGRKLGIGIRRLLIRWGD